MTQPTEPQPAAPLPAKVLVEGVWYDNPALYREDVSDQVMRTLHLPPVQWVIPDLVTAGLNLLVSPPKTGKSWLKMAMEQAVAYGGQFLGTPVGPAAPVLSVALEDNVRRVQTRARMLTPDHLVPDARDAYHYHFQWPGANTSERIGWLAAYLEMQRKTGNPFRLVTVDTLRKFVGPYNSSKNAYDQDNTMASRLNELGMEYDVGIVVPHHTNKIRISGDDEGDWLDRISGSAGLAGSSTTIMYLERSRGADTGVLHTTSWDGEDQEIALRFSAGNWSRAEDLEPDEARRAGAVAQVLITLRKLGGLTMAELIDATRCGADAVRKACHRLQEQGEVAYDPASKVWERIDPGGPPPIVVTIPEAPAPAAPLPTVPVPTVTAVDQDDEDEFPDTEDDDMAPDTKVSPAKSPGLKWIRESIASKNDTMHPVPLIKMDQRELPQWAATQQLLTGDHRWTLPQELVDEFDPDTGVFILDRNASYLSACSSIPLAPNVLSHTGDAPYDRKRAGAYLIDSPPWDDPRIGHPLGKRATRRDRIWVGAPQMDTLIKLGLPAVVRDSYTGMRFTNMLDPFYRQARDYRAEKQGTEELAVFKRCAYGLRFLWTKRTRSPFWRPDWWTAMCEEANGRHWWKAYRYLEPGDGKPAPVMRLLAMQNTDTVTWLGGIPDAYEVDPVKLGAVKLSWSGTLREWKARDARER